MSKIFDFLSYNFIDYKSFKLSLLTVLGLLFIYVATRVFLRVVRVFINKRLVKKQLIDRAREFTIYTIIRYITLIVVTMIAMDTVGIDIKYLFGASAALLVGVGLALQNVFQDFVAGLVLLFEGTFKVGDVIEMNGMMAQVKKIDLRTSQVETRNGTVIIVPNSKLIQENIVNWTLNRKITRFNIKIGVAYNSDLDKVRYIIAKCLRDHPAISSSERISVALAEFGDSSINFNGFFWADDAWNVEFIKSDLRYAIAREFKEHKITIPFPQRDLHLVSSNIEFTTAQPGNQTQA